MYVGMKYILYNDLSQEKRSINMLLCPLTLKDLIWSLHYTTHKHCKSTRSIPFYNFFHRKVEELLCFILQYRTFKKQCD